MANGKRPPPIFGRFNVFKDLVKFWLKSTKQVSFLRFPPVFAVSQQADFMFSFLKSRNSLVELTLFGSISVGPQKQKFVFFFLILRVIGKAKVDFVQFVTQCVFADIQ